MKPFLLSALYDVKYNAFTSPIRRVQTNLYPVHFVKLQSCAKIKHAVERYKGLLHVNKQQN